jgi:hypothetical protein
MRLMGRALSLAALPLAIAGALAAGCGLVDLEKLTSVTFKLPPQTFTIDSHDEGRWHRPPESFAAPVPCSVPSDCCMPPDGPALSCAQYPVACQAGRCAIEFAVEIASPVNLRRDVPELARARGQVLADLVLDSVEYTADNQLGMALPEVTLFVAPAGVSSAGSTKARRVGTIPVTNDGLQASGVVPLTAEGREAFAAIARDLESPFNLIATTRVAIVSGTPAPNGKVALSVTGRITVRF